MHVERNAILVFFFVSSYTLVKNRSWICCCCGCGSSFKSWNLLLLQVRKFFHDAINVWLSPFSAHPPKHPTFNFHFCMSIIRPSPQTPGKCSIIITIIIFTGGLCRLWSRRWVRMCGSDFTFLLSVPGLISLLLHFDCAAWLPWRVISWSAQCAARPATPLCPAAVRLGREATACHGSAGLAHMWAVSVCGMNKILPCYHFMTWQGFTTRAKQAGTLLMIIYCAPCPREMYLCDLCASCF